MQLSVTHPEDSEHLPGSSNRCLNFLCISCLTSRDEHGSILQQYRQLPTIVAKLTVQFRYLFTEDVQTNSCIIGQTWTAAVSLSRPSDCLRKPLRACSYTKQADQPCCTCVVKMLTALPTFRCSFGSVVMPAMSLTQRRAKSSNLQINRTYDLETTISPAQACAPLQNATDKL